MSALDFERLGLYVVLTMRGIESSKTRLSDALSRQERARLNRWLLDRTLGVLTQWLPAMDRCLFVSPCTTALEIAGGAGVELLPEPGGAGGHNHAAHVGSRHLRARGAQRVVMLPCDLPLLCASALDEYVAHAAAADFLLAPDAEGSGTNSVLVPAAPDLEFYFGPGSRARYLAYAQARGWRTHVHTAHALAFDLDTPADYARWETTEYPAKASRSG